MTIAARTAAFADQAVVARLEALTGHPIRWSGWVGRQAFLQWTGPIFAARSAGLIWLDLDGQPCFARLTFDPHAFARRGLDAADLAALGMVRAGATQYVGPARDLRLVRAKRVSRAAVEAHAQAERDRLT